MKIFRRFLGAWLLLFGWSAAAVGQTQNGTTVGSLTLSSTLNCISVRASFPGDANPNNAVSVQFQKTAGETAFHAAYTPFIDRRTTLGGVANKYANEARV